MTEFLVTKRAGDGVNSSCESSKNNNLSHSLGFETQAFVVT